MTDETVSTLPPVPEAISQKIAGPSLPPPLDRTKLSSACQTCPASCCQLIFLNTNEAKIRKMETENPNRIPLEFRQEIARVRELFIPVWVPDYIRQRYRLSSYYSHISRETFSHVCRAYDYQTKRCTDYEHRPALCREFMCHASCGNTANEQAVLRIKDNEIQHSMFDGTEPLRRWLIRLIPLSPRFAIVALWFCYNFRRNPAPAVAAIKAAKITKRLRNLWAYRQWYRLRLRRFKLHGFDMAAKGEDKTVCAIVEKKELT